MPASTHAAHNPMPKSSCLRSVRSHHECQIPHPVSAASHRRNRPTTRCRWTSSAPSATASSRDSRPGRRSRWIDLGRGNKKFRPSACHLGQGWRRHPFTPRTPPSWTTASRGPATLGGLNETQTLRRPAPREPGRHFFVALSPIHGTCKTGCRSPYRFRLIRKSLSGNP